MELVPPQVIGRVIDLITTDTLTSNTLIYSSHADYCCGFNLHIRFLAHYDFCASNRLGLSCASSL